jgi:hypothetical protein
MHSNRHERVRAMPDYKDKSKHWLRIIKTKSTSSRTASQAISSHHRSISKIPLVKTPIKAILLDAGHKSITTPNALKTTYGAFDQSVRTGITYGMLRESSIAKQHPNIATPLVLEPMSVGTDIHLSHTNDECKRPHIDANYPHMHVSNAKADDKDNIKHRTTIPCSNLSDKEMTLINTFHPFRTLFNFLAEVSMSSDCRISTQYAKGTMFSESLWSPGVNVAYCDAKIFHCPIQIRTVSGGWFLLNGFLEDNTVTDVMKLEDMELWYPAAVSAAGRHAIASALQILRSQANSQNQLVPLYRLVVAPLSDSAAYAARVAFVQIVQYFLRAGCAVQRPRSMIKKVHADDTYITAMAIDNFSYEPSHRVTL